MAWGGLGRSLLLPRGVRGVEAESRNEGQAEARGGGGGVANAAEEE